MKSILEKIKRVSDEVSKKVKKISDKFSKLPGWQRVLIYLIAAALLPLIISNGYVVHILILLGVYLVLGTSLNLITGVTGELDLGHAAFFGLGAYASSLFAQKIFDSFWLGILAAFLFSMLCGILLGIPSLRIRGDYLAIVTMGFNEIVRYVMINWQEVTNGPLGVSKIHTPKLFGFDLGTKQFMFYLIAIIMLITYVVIRRITISKTGRALVAVRENEIAATSLGIKTGYYKIVAFAVSAAFAGVAGSFYAHYMSFINPNNFTTNDSITILCMVVIGGKGSLLGTIVGVATLYLLPEVLRSLESYRMLIYGIMIVIMMIYRPKGFCPEKRVPERMEIKHGNSEN